MRRGGCVRVDGQRAAAADERNKSESSAFEREADCTQPTVVMHAPEAEI